MQTTATESWNLKEPEIMEMASRLDCDAAIDFEQDARIFIQRGAKELVLNCAGLTVMTGAGLRAMLTMAKEMKQVEGKLVVCNLQGQPQEMFEACGFNEIIPAYSNKDKAFARMAA